MVAKTIFETYDKNKVDELISEANSWVQLTTEEYTDGSVYDSTTHTLKQDILVEFRNSGVTQTVVIPKRVYDADPCVCFILNNIQASRLGTV